MTLIPQRIFRFPGRTRSSIKQDVEAELEFHIEMRVKELLAQGVSASNAQQQATQEFGDIEFTRQYCQRIDERSARADRSASRIADWQQDLQYAWRTLRRSKGFAAVSLITLTLAIGANTAIFTVARAVLLKPLPYGSSSAVVQLDQFSTDRPDQKYQFSPADFVDYRAQQQSFTDVAAYKGYSPTWQPEHGDPEILRAATVTTNTFDVLNVRAAYGRAFGSHDSLASAAQTVVLSNQFWQRAFGGDTAVLGRKVLLNGDAFRVVGIMPPGFTLGIDDQLWLTFNLDELLADVVRARRQHYLRVVARLKPGVTVTKASTDLKTIANRLAAQYPESDKGTGASARSIREAMTGSFTSPLLLLQCAALAVLLIACANLANLTLSRTIGRRREMALRAALGASRMRIVRQLITESLLLAVVGGACGALFAAFATRRLLALNPETLPTMYEANTDASVLLFSIAVSVLTGLLFGLVPAIGAGRANVNDALKDAGRGSSGGRKGEQLRHTLVVAQMGLAVMLLVGAGLLVRSFAALTSVPMGFATDHVLTAMIRTSGARYDSAAVVNQFYDGLFRDITAEKGVLAVGGTTVLPTRGHLGSKLRIVGQPIDETNLPDIGYQAVRGDYFAVMRIPVLQGRSYNKFDDTNADKPVIINNAAAKQFFPKGDAIGKQISIGPDPHSAPWTIVGIVGDARDEGADTPARPMLFANHVKETWDPTLNIVIRTSGDARLATAALRRAVKEHDATLALSEVGVLSDVVGMSLAPRRFALGLATCFAVVALALAAVGIYGVLAYAVTNRTREFGVRLALGATAKNVVLLVVKQGVAWSVVGLVLGTGGALATTRVLAGMLYATSPMDPVTYVLVALGLLIVVAMACVVPALRATRVDPLTSMRAE